MATTINTIPAWIKFFSSTPIPVLKQTERALDEIKTDDNKLCARAISAIVMDDPLMVFKVLSYAQTHKGRHQIHDLVHVEQAILMMGTEAFFNQLAPAPLVETVLSANIVALTHILKLIKRAHRAAHFATDWAVMLQDIHADELRVAALLHDLGEMLMWCFAPDKMQAIFNAQQLDKTLRSKAAQEQFLGFKLIDLQKALIEAFNLPELLSRLMLEDAINEQRVKNVTLAVNLARHLANGWNDAALPDDYRDIAKLLRLDVERVKFIVGVPKEASLD